MPKSKGLPKTGGRKKGTPNKKTSEVVKAVKAGGVTPLDYMLDVMRKPIPSEAEPAVKVAMIGLRFEAAKAAAPYVHPKLAAIEHTGKDGEGLFSIRALIEAVGLNAARFDVKP